MQPRTCLAVVALSIALLTPMGVGWLSVEQAEPAASSLPAKIRKKSKPEEQLVTVLVASRPVPQGTYIKNPEEWFEFKMLPRNSVPENAATKLDQVREHVAGKAVAAAGIVNPDDFLRKEGQFFIGLPRGKRATTIRVSHSDCLAFQPGSRVSIENRVENEKTREGYSQTILENMLILATEPVDASAPREGSGPWSDTVTLEVTREEAETLSLAQVMGTLRLTQPRTLPTSKRALTLRFSHPGCREFQAGSEVHVEYSENGKAVRLTSEPLVITAAHPSTDPEYGERNTVTFMVTPEQAEELSSMPGFCQLRLVRSTTKSDEP